MRERREKTRERGEMKGGGGELNEGEEEEERRDQKGGRE